MRTYFCRLSRHDEWYPMMASRPQKAAEDFALMWIGPGLRTVSFVIAAPKGREYLMLVELAYREEDLMVVPVWVWGKAL